MHTKLFGFPIFWLSTWWKLFQKLAMLPKLDIYVFSWRADGTGFIQWKLHVFFSDVMYNLQNISTHQ
jgi:hypothetical protein